MPDRYLRLCLVTHITSQSVDAYKNFIFHAVQGGVSSVQLRVKNKTYSEILLLATELKALLKPLNIPLIINDHLEIAKKIDADGLHLGQSDYSPSEARRELGTDKIIGWSVETLEELNAANQLTCINYIAASAVFSSKTKQDCKTIWGLHGLQKIVKISKHPVIAIGGINETNIQKVIACGVQGIAVVSAIHDSSDPKKAAADLILHADKIIDTN